MNLRKRLSPHIWLWDTPDGSLSTWQERVRQHWELAEILPTKNCFFFLIDEKMSVENLHEDIRESVKMVCLCSRLTVNHLHPDTLWHATRHDSLWGGLATERCHRGGSNESVLALSLPPYLSVNISINMTFYRWHIGNTCIERSVRAEFLFTWRRLQN